MIAFSRSQQNRRDCEQKIQRLVWKRLSTLSMIALNTKIVKGQRTADRANQHPQEGACLSDNHSVVLAEQRKHAHTIQIHGTDTFQNDEKLLPVAERGVCCAINSQTEKHLLTHLIWKSIMRRVQENQLHRKHVCLLHE